MRYTKNKNKRVYFNKKTKKKKTKKTNNATKKKTKKYKINNKRFR